MKMSQKRDIFYVIYISGGKRVIMTEIELYEELINLIIKESDLSIEKTTEKVASYFNKLKSNKNPIWIYPRSQKSYIKRVSKKLFSEWNHYYDEVYWHWLIYETSFMDEVPTPERIMKRFDISYFFAKQVFDYYMEVANDVK